MLDEREGLSDGRRTVIFLNLMVACVATSALSTALSTALPPIIVDLGISASQGQWLTSGFSLAMGITMPLTAFLITRFNTKPLYVAALVMAVAGMAVAAVASSFEVLMFGRVLQALSNGITSSLAQVVLLTIYPPQRRGAVMGWYGLSVSAAPIVAPTLAGLLVDFVSWRAIFVVAGVVMLLALVLTLFVFQNVLDVRKQKFDVLSFALSGLAFGGFTLGVGNLASGAVNAAALIPLAVGLVAGVFFARRQLTVADPFLDLRVLKVRRFFLSVACSMLLYAVMMSATIMVPLYIQSILGHSAAISALVLMPGSAVSALVSPLAGRIYDAVGMRVLSIVGSVGILAATLPMAFLTTDSPLWVVSVLHVIRCIAIGCTMMPFVTWGVGGLNAQQMPHGNALLQSFRTIAGALGMAVFVGVMTTVGQGSSLIMGHSVSYVALSVLAAAMVVLCATCVRSKPARG